MGGQEILLTREKKKHTHKSKKTINEVQLSNLSACQREILLKRSWAICQIETKRLTLCHKTCLSENLSLRCENYTPTKYSKQWHMIWPSSFSKNQQTQSIITDLRLQGTPYKNREDGNDSTENKEEKHKQNERTNNCREGVVARRGCSQRWGHVNQWSLELMDAENERVLFSFLAES